VKVYDVKSVFEQHNECYEICEQCEYGESYYESDTGYSDVSCKGEFPNDCQEAIKNYFEDEENEEMNNTNEMNLTFNIESFKESIISSIKRELKDDIKNQLKNELIKQVYTEIVQPQIDEIKTSISFIVSEMLKKEIESYYNETKIQIGGGYGSEPKEYTVKQYTELMIKESIEKGMTKKKGRYGEESVNFKDYLVDNCINSEINSFMEKELKNVQKDVNKKVQSVFETKVNTMMSEVALGVLKSNATYNDVTRKLLGE